MKLFLVFPTVVTYLALFLSKVEGGAYDDGRTEGTNMANNLWSNDFNEDCDNVYKLRDAVNGELNNPSYKPSWRDNWQQEAYKKGVKQGAMDVTNQVEQTCLTPGFAEDMGQTAAEMIAGEFCGLHIATMTNDIRNVARQDSIDTCKGQIQSEVQKLASNCSAIQNDMNNFTFDQKNKLKNKCTEVVDRWTEKSGSNRGNNGKKRALIRGME